TPSAIQQPLSSLFSQTIQQPFTHTNIQETQQPISTLTRPIIQKQRPSSVPPVLQRPSIKTTNQQVIPTYIPSAIQPSISSYI
ncbi:unnamed protein product, partial [Rotaria sp. Silwood1]